MNQRSTKLPSPLKSQDKLTKRQVKMFANEGKLKSQQLAT